MSEQPGDEHPLFFELRTTRAVLARSQEEVHASTVKLQRYSLDTARTHELAVSLKRENELLKAELAVLRATPTPADPSFVSQAHIQELTLSLRKLSHKLTLTEEALLAKTEALITAQADLTKAQIGLEVAYELGAKLRSREDVEKVRVKKLELKIMRLEEAVRMSDVALAEYAKLVRDMEARPMSLDLTAQPSKERAGDANIISALSEGLFNSQHLAENFRAQYDELHHEVRSLQGELEVARSQLEAENKGETAILAECAWTKTELDKLRVDDKTAAKLVARYMQFSQSSTNSLSASLESLRARHDATVATLSSQNHILTSRICGLDSQNEHLRTILDDLGGEIMKEKFGRRREISLRIRMGGREERVVEGLRRWVRKGEEAVGGFERKGDDDGHAAQLELKSSLIAMSQDARILLESLEEGGADEETSLSLSGARAREVMVRDGVEGLLEELRTETERRILQQVRPLAVYARDGHSQHLTENDSTISHSLSSSPEERENHQRGGQLIGEENIVLVIPPGPVEADLSVLSTDGHRIVDKELDLSNGSRKDFSPSSALTSDLSKTQPIDGNQVLVFGETHSTMGPLSPNTEASTTHHPEEIIICTYSNNDTEEVKSGAPEIPCQSVEETLSAAALSSAAPLLRSLVPPTPSTEHLSDAQPFLGPQSTSSESSFEFSDDSQQSESKTLDELLPHPLLADLAKVHKRYDSFQRAFKDCNLALEGLKADLASCSSSVFAHSGQQKIFTSIPMDVLHTAVARLDDFTEDVRVELEIKIGDDVLLAKGYEALLRVPGALHSSSSQSQSQTKAHSDRTAAEGETDIDTSLSYAAVEKQIEVFLNGTDPTVRKAKETFARKLEDVQHDIAALKRALHDPESFSEGLSPSASMTSLLSPSKMENGLDSATGQGGGWAAWITGSASRPTTPTPSLGPSHTFGNIMTSPRLKNSLGSESHLKSQSPKKTSVFGSLGVLGGKDQPKDPLSLLGLKVPMPSFTMDGYSISGRIGNGFISSSPMSATFGGMMLPSYPSTIGTAQMGVSKSTLSTMYMYGLGALGSSRSPSVVGAGGKLMRSVSANTSGSVNDMTLPLGRSRQSMGGHDFNSMNSLERERGKDAGDNDIE